MTAEDCTICKGTGYISVTEVTPCAACDGTGKVIGSVCFYCHGTGTQIIDARAFCPLCNPEVH